MEYEGSIVEVVARGIRGGNANGSVTTGSGTDSATAGAAFFFLDLLAFFSPSSNGSPPRQHTSSIGMENSYSHLFNGPVYIF